MTLYAIYDPRSGRPDLPAAVPESFSWLAALLPPIFLLQHGLWLELVAYGLKVAALIVLSRFIGDDAAFILYCLAASWLGFAAADLRGHALRWRGWRLRENRVALSAQLAQLGALR